MLQFIAVSAVHACASGTAINCNINFKLHRLINSLLSFYSQQRASLACAARLVDTSCPPEAPFGRLEVTLVN